MPTSNTPSVAVAVPVPTPVQSKPKAPTAPKSATVSKGSDDDKKKQGQVPQIQFVRPPKPQMRALIIPWTPGPRRMRRSGYIRRYGKTYRISTVYAQNSPTNRWAVDHWEPRWSTQNNGEEYWEWNHVGQEVYSDINKLKSDYPNAKLYVGSKMGKRKLTDEELDDFLKHTDAPEQDWRPNEAMPEDFYSMRRLPKKVIKYAINRVGTNYEKANTFLGNRNQRRLAGNKILYRDSDGNIHVRLHATNVVTYHPDGGMTVNTGGYRTRTTAQTIQDYTGLRVSFAGGRFRIGGEEVQGDTHHIPGPNAKPLSTGEALWKAVNADPLDATVHHAYADHRYEEGFPDDSEFHRTLADMKQKGLIHRYDPSRIGFEFGIRIADLPRSMKDATRNSFVAFRNSPEPGISNDEVLWSTHDHMVNRLKEVFSPSTPR